MITTRFRFFRKSALASTILFAALPAIPSLAQNELAAELAKLDASAAKFKSAQADLVWDNVQTVPVSDSDSQVGTILFARKGSELQIALHIVTDQGKPALKDVVYSDGVGKMYQPSIKQMQVFKVGDNRAALDAYLTLGFGGSGQDLKKNWDVAYQGIEPVNGKPAVKLELKPRDPQLAKTTPRVLLWIDTTLDLAVKQQRFGADKGYVLFTYSNIRLNPSVSKGAFEIKTTKDTQIVNH
jgi:outer membrane lipoprotein-sorting protein